MKYFQLLLLLGILAFSTSCKKTKLSKEIPTDELTDIPVVTDKNIEVLYSEGAMVKIKVTAPTSLRMQNQDQILPDGFLLTLYDNLGNPKTTMKGDSAILINKVQVWTMVGNVEVKNIIENQQLNTEILNWNQKLKEVYTNENVKITTDKELLYGVGMRAKEDFSQYKIAKPTGVFSVDSETSK
ncbi:MAG: LPS export ABC transporter protein LptC [Arenicella sp.]|jgi:LPS export ABC transporter protein LptC